MKPSLCLRLCAMTMCLGATVSSAAAANRVKTANGVLESTAPPVNGVRSFKGIPFAAPPVGDLRWREPQPVKNWTGVRNADQFGAHCMQVAGSGDYWFRSPMNEDCLYLNVWTPAKSSREKLPVLVYIYGGGFTGGSGCEPRYDGASMASHGIVAVTLNYRLGIFGFFTHPELTKESPHHASGNYGLLDQVAALEWVQKNIAAFGGDPKRVTIAGESAGSMSVSALMASPLSKNLIAGAIGESGAIISTMPPRALAAAEEDGVRFATSANASSLAALRAMTSEQLQAVRGGRFSTVLDGYFLPKTLPEIFSAGEQAKVPLLAGSNSEEQNYRSVLQQAEPTPENLAAAIRRLYSQASSAEVDAMIKAYTVSTPDEVLDAADDLASQRFIAYGTWKWTELQMKTGGKPVYRYFYTRVRPPFLGNPGQPAAAPAPAPTAAAQTSGGRGGAAGGRGNFAPAPPRGAAHSAEIQYAMGNLPIDPRYNWTDEDKKVSAAMQAYFINFIKTGNPNASGLPEWPAYSPSTNFARMRIDVTSSAAPEPHRDRYLALDAINSKQ